MEVQIDIKPDSYPNCFIQNEHGVVPVAKFGSADLYVGKLRMGYYNNANIETMMMGVPNMSYIRPKFRENIPDCPIIQATPDTVYAKLLEYLNKPDELREIGMKGPEFVKKYHDPEKIAKHLIKRYNEAFARKHQ